MFQLKPNKPKLEHKVVNGKKYIRYEGDDFWQEAN